MFTRGDKWSYGEGGSGILRVPWGRAIRPTRSRLVRSPFGTLERTTTSCAHERIRLVGHVGADAVHGFRDVIRHVAGDVFLECGAEHLAAGSSGTPGEALNTLKDFIRNGYGGFHTESMTEPGV
jgi:hypothetical protein